MITLRSRLGGLCEGSTMGRAYCSLPCVPREDLSGGNPLCSLSERSSISCFAVLLFEMPFLHQYLAVPVCVR